MPALAKAMGWAGMEPIDQNDFDGLYRLRYQPGSFVPEVLVSRQSKWFQQPCFLNANSPLPAVGLP